MDSWRVTWWDPTGTERFRVFPTYQDAWAFNQESLRGRGEVFLLTDRPLISERTAKSEAEEARQREGVRRRSRRQKNTG